MPIDVGDADDAIRRMIAGKPVIVTGDGSSLWTLTRSVDVARALVRAVRQCEGVQRRLPHHHRSSASRGIRSTTLLRGASARRRSMPMFRPTSSSPTTGSGRARCSATRRGRRCSTIPRSRVSSETFDASRDLDEILARLRHARQGTVERSAEPGGRGGGSADGQDHRCPSKGPAIVRVIARPIRAWRRSGFP